MAHVGDTGGRRWVNSLFLALGVILVGVLGIVSGLYGTGALVAVLGFIASALFLVRPKIGLMLLALTIPAQSVFALAEGVTLTKVAGVAVFLAWGANKLLRGESFKRIFTSGFFCIGGLFLALTLASELWAEVPGVATEGFKQLLLMFGWSLLIIDLIHSEKVADHFIKALLIGALLAAAITLQQYFFLGYRRAGVEVGGSANLTASMFLTLIPFGFYLMRSQTKKAWSLFGVAYVAIAVLAILVTFSRMNFLLLPLVLAVLLWETAHGRRGRGWVLGLAAAATMIGIWYVPWEEVVKRAQTIPEYIVGTIGSGEQYVGLATSGRGYHWAVGLAIALDHPLLGAGYRNYGYLFRDEYQFKVPGAGQVYGSVRSPHSSYIGMLADLGVVGSLLWLLLLYGVGVRCALNAWRLTRKKRESPLHLLARATTYAVLLQVVAYGWYAATDRDRIFWAILALSVAVMLLAREQVRPVTAFRPKMYTPVRAGPEVDSVGATVPGRSAATRI